jgi:cyclopropane-fatty-acyl-phospholipid synthase
MTQQVEYIEDDYRNIKGVYDVFVSIGMLEHVGIDQYQELSDVIDRCLKPQGIGLIHSIGRNQPSLLNEWIATRIFPGARPPSISQMMTIFEPKEFSILDIENLRLHYAKTLEHWLARFDQNADQFRKTYDEEFIRAWRLYLAGSIAAFTSGTMQLFQVVFTRPHNNNLPWSRAHLYKDHSHY